MSTQINNIKSQFPGSDKWHLQFPWFATGQLVEASRHLNMPDFGDVAQKAAIYFNDVHRFHWLLHEEELHPGHLLASFELDGETTGSEEEILTGAPGDLKPHVFTEEIGDGKRISIEKTSAAPPVALPEAVVLAYDPDDTDQPEDPDTREADLTSMTDIVEEKLENSSFSKSLAGVSKNFLEEPVTDEELIIAPEPYHTVDYFASQGIRLEPDHKQDDKFSQQLKSFTSWLKQMKRLPGIKISDKEPDPAVEQIASHSLEAGEVLTESMAEVLLKQGKTGQAIEVWKKLSLLHPEKSHYFASLIEKITL